MDCKGVKTKMGKVESWMLEPTKLEIRNSDMPMCHRGKWDDHVVEAEQLFVWCLRCKVKPSD